MSSAPARPAVDRARSLGLCVLDVEPLLRELIDSGEARLDQLFHLKQLPDGNLFVGHMTARGNGVVAAGIARWVLEGNAG